MSWFRKTLQFKSFQLLGCNVLRTPEDSLELKDLWLVAETCRSGKWRLHLSWMAQLGLEEGIWPEWL